MGELLIVLGVLCLVVGWSVAFLVALWALDGRAPTVVVRQVSSVGDQLEAEFRALDASKT